MDWLAAMHRASGCHDSGTWLWYTRREFIACALDVAYCGEDAEQVRWRDPWEVQNAAMECWEGVYTQICENHVGDRFHPRCMCSVVKSPAVSIAIAPPELKKRPGKDTTLVLDQN